MFNKYTNNSPQLVYSEVCDYFKDLGVGAQPNLNPAYSIYRSVPDGLIDNIRNELLSRGFHSFGRFQKIFKTADKNNNNFLSRDEFVWCMKENGINLTKNDFMKLFRFFDKNFDNQVSYSEFVQFFVPELNELRRGLILQAFDRLSAVGGGDPNVVNYLTIAQAYDPKEDPEVR